jgi:hypothetical protein
MGQNDGYYTGKRAELKSAAMTCCAALRLTACNLERKQIANTAEKEKKGNAFCGRYKIICYRSMDMEKECGILKLDEKIAKYGVSDI